LKMVDADLAVIKPQVFSKRSAGIGVHGACR